MYAEAMREAEGFPNVHCRCSGCRCTQEREILMEKEKNVVIPEVVLQYRQYEVNIDDVVARVKAHYVAKGHKEVDIEDIQVYVKPEDFTAYYVINDGIVGKINLF